MRPEDIPSLATLEFELNLSAFSNRDIYEINIHNIQRRQIKGTFSHKNLLEWGIKRPRPASFRRALVNLSTLNDNQKTYVDTQNKSVTYKQTNKITDRTDGAMFVIVLDTNVKFGEH